MMPSLKSQRDEALTVLRELYDAFEAAQLFGIAPDYQSNALSLASRVLEKYQKS